METIPKEMVKDAIDLAAMRHPLKIKGVKHTPLCLGTF
jgi:hypothetical protein